MQELREIGRKEAEESVGLPDICIHCIEMTVAYAPPLIDACVPILINSGVIVLLKIVRIAITRPITRV